MGRIADAILPSARTTRAYAERLLKDVQPAQFARLAKGVESNHPAWIFGHLSIYPDRVLEMLGRPELAKPREGFEKIFGAGASAEPMRDDPSGSIYPDMESITAYYFDRTDAVISALAETSDEQLQKPNPNERMADRFPTVGAMTDFMLGAHSMMHFGQLSTWRRIMGLGPCM